MKTNISSLSLSLSLTAAGALLFLAPPLANAEVDPKAAEILKGFCDKITAAKGFGYTAYRILDQQLAMETGGQKSARIEIAVARPNQLTMTSHGNLGTMHLIFDGNTVTIHDELMNLYSQGAAGPDIDNLVELLEQTFGIAPPLMGLALKDPYTALMQATTKGSYVGVEKVRGIDCHRLSFVTPTQDWEIWVGKEEGLPRKMEISYRRQNSAEPKVRIEFLGWGKSATLAARGYSFVPPRGAQQVPLAAIQKIEKDRYKAQLQKRK